jgi:peptide-methionine (S)-S-oxide reductase
MAKLSKIGFGGGCHWCTEAVFQSIKGVNNVLQGYISSVGDAQEYSEGVIVMYNPKIVSLKTLFEIHLQTHESTSQHSFREKYRSAIYFYNDIDREVSEKHLKFLQPLFDEKIITKVLPFNTFKESRNEIKNYFIKNLEAPFCKTYIIPKLKKVEDIFKENFKIID